MKLLIQLVREILHLSGKSQGKVREFQTPMAVATMLILCSTICVHSATRHNILENVVSRALNFLFVTNEIVGRMDNI